MLVEIFVDWLYTGQVPQVPQGLREWTPVAEQSACHIGRTSEPSLFTRIVRHKLKAYVFGVRFLSKQFKQTVFRNYLDYLHFSNERLEYHLVIYAFANLPESDPLLRHVVDQHCRNFNKYDDDKTDTEESCQLPHAFLTRVMLRYRKIVAGIEQKPLFAEDYLVAE